MPENWEPVYLRGLAVVMVVIGALVVLVDGPPLILRIEGAAMLAIAAAGWQKMRTDERVTEARDRAEVAASLLSQEHGGIDEHDGCSSCAALHLLSGRRDKRSATKGGT